MRRRRPRTEEVRQIRPDQFPGGDRQLPPLEYGAPSPARRASGRRQAGEIARKIAMWTFQILIVILSAYIVVNFYGQSRTNIGQSMEMTLQGGDTVLLDTFAYQIGSPKRGDIISFRPNGSTTAHSNIKRVIALPGETIQIREGIIYIDGYMLQESKNYPAITNPGMAGEELTLKAGEYFVLGDNRNNSEDSRFADIGMVKSTDIEGKVWYILSPAQNRGRIRD